MKSKEFPDEGSLNLISFMTPVLRALTNNYHYNLLKKTWDESFLTILPSDSKS